jgi:hypothetical protein
MIVEIPGFPFYGQLEKTKHGTFVLLCRWDRPSNQRNVMCETVKAPIGIVAEHLRQILMEGHQNDQDILHRPQ